MYLCICMQYFVQDTVFSYFCGQNMTYGVWSSIIIRESKLIPIYRGITTLLNSIVELHAIPQVNMAPWHHATVRSG